jgi:hypothetical protein
VSQNPFTDEELRDMRSRLYRKCLSIALMNGRPHSFISALTKLIIACNTDSVSSLPLKVVPLANQYVDKYVKDHGFVELAL